MFVKLFVSAFVLFAISRVWLRRRDGSIGLIGAVVWSALWIGVAGFTWWPKVTDFFAQKVGIGRGADALVYLSIIGLFYASFRLYVKLESVEHELTSLVRALSLREKRDGKKDDDFQA